jgi:23S rRNA pseudouridine1911/1915/1917 synthase
MSYLGHPVAGDLVYGRAGAKYKTLGGQCLHAKKIGFIHPKGEYMEFSSNMPEYFEKFLKKLERIE